MSAWYTNDVKSLSDLLALSALVSLLACRVLLSFLIFLCGFGVVLGPSNGF